MILVRTGRASHPFHEQPEMETLSLLSQASYDRHLTVDTARRIPQCAALFLCASIQKLQAHRTMSAR